VLDDRKLLELLFVDRILYIEMAGGHIINI